MPWKPLFPSAIWVPGELSADPAEACPRVAGVDGLRALLVGLPLTGLEEERLASTWERTREAGSERWSFRLDPEQRWPSGEAVTPRDVIDLWQQRLASGCEPARRLLSPVAGVADFVAGDSKYVPGLLEQGTTLVVRLTRSTPDFERRLLHPALYVWGESGGPGPLGVPDEGSPFAYTWGEDASGPGMRLYGADQDPRLLLAMEQVGLAVLYGRDIEAAGEIEGVFLHPAPGWERRFALLFDTSDRWGTDPTFRRHLAGRLDREGMAEALFAGGAHPIGSFLVPDRGLREAGDPVRFSSTPRLRLGHDPSDPMHSTIAARLRSDLAVAGIELEPVPGPDAELSLVDYRPWLQDRVVALEAALRGLPGDAAWIRSLDLANGIEDPRARKAAVVRLESEAISQHILVPLIGVDARFASRQENYGSWISHRPPMLPAWGIQ
ncbi:hypothetical protein ABI59_00295 [Acidobacteria bacterium Mor1]|nr:hypothetical protein ABI59_00295 [Acidobacteria bacterium Mor1]